jgi:ribonuclease HI
MTEYISEWKQRQWRRKHGPLLNAYLWIELDELASLHKPTWRWTRGHADHEDNFRCDLLARNASATQKSSWADGRPHEPLRLGLGPDYVPAKPKAKPRP